MSWPDPEGNDSGYRPMTRAKWDFWFDEVMWVPRPRWRPRWGMVAVAVAVSCVLWAAILVPLILWWPW
jgi:hypothetical protein